MAKDYRMIDFLRRNRSEHENHLIDGLLDGRVNRRDFLRHGVVLGMSVPLLGSIATAAGVAGWPSFARAAGSGGGTIKIAITVPAAAIEPVSVADNGGLCMLATTGEYLAVDGKDLVLRPVLASSWSPNKDGTVWTFKLREGVKFHDGSAFSANDVVATMDRLTDTANSSNALSAFRGYLSKGGTKKVDDHTVEFHLDAANGNFPYLVSSDNYNTIIVPENYKGDFEQNFNGTGPFKLEKYTPKVGASFVRNDDYWGEKALPDRLEFSFFDTIQPQILALQAGKVHIVQQTPVLAALPILKDPNIELMSIPSVAHEQVHMRTDMEPFKDKRVRQAIALCLDRPKIIKGLMQGRAQLGNDSPFASAYPSTDKTVQQREKDIAQAKQLMEAAGMKDGFEVTLTTEKYLEIPEYAQLIQSAVKAINGKITLKIEDQGAYYGDAVFGKSDWLDSTMGITDYGHRGVPNVYLSAPLRSDGTWNSAHFKSPQYDKLVDSYVAALDLETQRTEAGKIQRLLLDETPVIFSYFYDYLSGIRKGVVGVMPTAMGQLYLAQTTGV
jgi:peptide/nickel transport system substrate-binding protein